jgi:hypothetical protein
LYRQLLNIYYLKRFLLILSLILTTTLTLQAQTSPIGPNGTKPAVMRFYPNPATTVITFDFQQSHDKGYSLQIYNMIGRKMVEQVNISDQTSVNLTDFTRGVYIYKLFDRTGRLVETGKFQVSK